MIYTETLSHSDLHRYGKCRNTIFFIFSHQWFTCRIITRQGSAAAPSNKVALTALDNAANVNATTAAAVEELNNENNMLKERNASMQKQLSEMMKERTDVQNKMANMEAALGKMKSAGAGSGAGSAEFKELEGQVSNTKGMLDAKQGEMERIKADLQGR